MKYWSKTIIPGILVCLFALQATAQSVIPFEIGTDNRIYIDVQVNGSDPYRFIFDTGANAVVVNSTRFKERLSFDEITENQGANGVSRRRMSNYNHLSIAGFSKHRVSMVEIRYPESYEFDGVIGHSFFKGHYIHINYQKKELIIYDEKDDIPKLKSFQKLPVRMIADVPFVDIQLSDSVEFLAMIDTGYNDGIIIYHDQVKKHHLLDVLPIEGTAYSEGTDGKKISLAQANIPSIILGEAELSDIPAFLHKTNVNSPFPAILGGTALKHVEIILSIDTRACYVKAAK